MKTLQREFTTLFNWKSTTTENRLLCLLDVEFNRQYLNQVSVVVCKENPEELAIVDTLNVYIDESTVSTSRLQLIDFFRKYPDMIYIGNNIKGDMTLISRFITGISLLEKPAHAFSNEKHLNKFKNMLKKYEDECHCKNQLFKLEFKCWLNDNSFELNCPYELACKYYAVRYFLFGNGYSCVETSSDQIYKLYKSNFNSMLPNCKLSSLQEYLEITNLQVNETLKEIFNLDKAKFYPHNSMFDVTLMYIIMSLMKVRLNAKYIRNPKVIIDTVRHNCYVRGIHVIKEHLISV